MSGGVDSTAAALLLRQQFGRQNLHGFYMHLFQPNHERQRQRVQDIAERIGIPLTVIDFREQFEQKILRYFSASYLQGLTPNPCIICNKEIKFGLFVDAILARGMQQVATGHYARLVSNKGYHLFMGKDRHKDQSYFLSRLSQGQLAKILFPLGELQKNTVYDFVEEHGFIDFRGTESQDICFLEKGGVGNFLSQRHDTMINGFIVDSSGQNRGEHHGIHNYTIGQRKGLGISNPKPLYVIALNAQRNEVVVGEEHELFQQKINLDQLHWLSGIPPENRTKLLVKIRYTHSGASARLEYDETRGKIFFEQPQRAVTPGQFAVFYRGEELLGSGVIV